MSDTAGWALPGDQVPSDEVYSHAVAVYFDEESESAIASWRASARVTEPPVEQRTRPHLTLACVDAGVFDVALPTHVPAEVTVAAVGAFPSALDLLAAFPTPSPALIELHAATHRALAGTANFDYYRPGLWIPHLTLATGLSPQHQADGFHRLLGRFPVRLRTRGLGVFSFADDTITWCGE